MKESTVLIGFTVEGFQDWHPAVITAAMRRLGINFIEYNTRILDELDRVVPQLRGVQTAFHLPIIEEDGWDFSCPAQQDKIDQTVAILQRFNQQLGLTHFIAHPPQCSGPAVDESGYKILFNAVAKLPLPVYFENVVTTTPEQFRDFLTLAKTHLGAHYGGMCYDAAHFYISGCDPVEQFQAFRDEIGAIHLSDCIGKADSHLPFSSGGELPIKKLLQVMRKSKYTGSITLEIRPSPGGNLVAYIESYLLMLRTFSLRRYLSARIRLIAARHVIKHRK